MGKNVCNSKPTPFCIRRDGRQLKRKTKYHGEIEVQQEEILHFAKGIPGFLEEKQFVVLPLSDDGVYSILQSTENEHLAFVITNPFHFFKDYDFELEAAVIEELELQSDKDVQVFSILTVQEPFEQTTVNLQAPIIINTKTHKAKQVILNHASYKIKHPLFQNVTTSTVQE